MDDAYVDGLLPARYWAVILIPSLAIICPASDCGHTWPRA
jgi:hypothetical protein